MEITIFNRKIIYIWAILWAIFNSYLKYKWAMFNSYLKLPESVVHESPPYHHPRLSSHHRSDLVQLEAAFQMSLRLRVRCVAKTGGKTGGKTKKTMDNDGKSHEITKKTRGSTKRNKQFTTISCSWGDFDWFFQGEISPIIIWSPQNYSQQLRCQGMRSLRPTPLKNDGVSSSVGMMTFPTKWKNNPVMFQTNQF